jgi:hypothetical protein
MAQKGYKLGFIEIPTEQLVKADWNYKTEDKKKQEKLKENIKRNGQIENIIVRLLDTGFYEVVNGNHRLDVLKDLKQKKVYCYNFGKISDVKAQKVAIETNETKFDTDNLKLAELLSEIGKEFDVDELVKTMPYSKQELENFEQLLEFDWEQYNNEKSLDDEDYVEKYVKIQLDVSEHTYKLWLDINKKMEKILGYKNEGKVFEFMCAEMNNVPLESIK